MMPYWPEVAGAPQNSIIGGATLWVLRDRPRAEYAGVAQFFAYLSKPEVQAAWHQNTGYLPITRAAFDLTRAQGFYDRNPGAAISIEQMTLKPPTENSKGIRLGSFVLIRDVIEEELEQVFSGKRVRAGGPRPRRRARQPPAAPVRAGQSGPVSNRHGSHSRSEATKQFSLLRLWIASLRRSLRLSRRASLPASQTTNLSHLAPIRRNGCRSALDIARSHGLACTAPHVFSTGTNLVVALDEKLILKIFPPFLRRQFVSERGSLAQLHGRASVAIPEIVVEGERDGWPYLVITRLSGVLGADAWPSLAGSGQGARACGNRRDHRRGAARSARSARADRAATGTLSCAGRSRDAAPGTSVSDCRRNFSMGWTTCCATRPADPAGCAAGDPDRRIHPGEFPAEPRRYGRGVSPGCSISAT